MQHFNNLKCYISIMLQEPAARMEGVTIGWSLTQHNKDKCPKKQRYRTKLR